MKKFSWILALLAALALVFVGVGCSSSSDPDPDPDPDDTWVETTVFDFQEYLADNEITTSSVRADIFDEVFLTGADGDGAQVSYEIIDEDGVLKLKFTTVADWAGIDIMNKGIQFMADDVLTIKGYVVTATSLFLNINNNGETTLGGWKPSLAAGDEFDETFTLTAANVQAIKNNAYVPGIRIRSGAAKTIVIEQITVTGLRPAGGLADFTDLETALIEAETLLDTTDVSTDGTDVVTTRFWVTEAVFDAYVAVAEAAFEIFEDPASTQAKIDAEVATLTTATATFKAARQAGTAAALEGTVGDIFTFTGLTPTNWATIAATEVTEGDAFTAITDILTAGDGSPTITWVEYSGKLALKVAGSGNFGVKMFLNILGAYDSIEIKGRANVSAAGTGNRAMAAVVINSWGATGIWSAQQDNLGGDHIAAPTNFTLAGTMGSDTPDSWATGLAVRVHNNPAAVEDGAIDSFLITSIKVVRTPQLAGTITLAGPNAEVVVGDTLTATYSGSETVTYLFKKDGVDVDTAGAASTLVTTEAGIYTVTVSAEGLLPKTSSPVTVIDPSFTAADPMTWQELIDGDFISKDGGSTTLAVDAAGLTQTGRENNWDGINVDVAALRDAFGPGDIEFDLSFDPILEYAAGTFNGRAMLAGSEGVQSDNPGATVTLTLLATDLGGGGGDFGITSGIRIVVNQMQSGAAHPSITITDIKVDGNSIINND